MHVCVPTHVRVHAYVRMCASHMDFCIVHFCSEGSLALQMSEEDPQTKTAHPGWGGGQEQNFLLFADYAPNGELEANGR